MKILNILFIGNFPLCNELSSLVDECGHIISFCDDFSFIQEHYDLVVTCENSDSALSYLSSYATNVLLISSNHGQVCDKTILENISNLALYVTSGSGENFMFSSIAFELCEPLSVKLLWIKEQLMDFVASLSRRNRHLRNYQESHLIDWRSFTYAPDQIRVCISHLLRRLGDFNDGLSLNSFAFMTWYPGASFQVSNTLTNTLTGTSANYFFYNECSSALKNGCINSDIMIRMVKHSDKTEVQVFGDDQRFRHFTQYLSVLLSSPIDSCSLMQDRFLVRKLEEFNDTDEQIYLKGDVVATFRNRVADIPEHAAIRWRDDELTYSELDSQSDLIALWLMNKGAGCHSTIAICMPRSPLLITAIIGCMKCNITFVLVDPGTPRTRCKKILLDCSPEMILTDGHFQFKGNKIFNLNKITLTDDTDCSAKLPNLRNGTAYICYTSGTTGKPKGVMVTRAGLQNVIQNHCSLLQMEPGSHVLSISSPAFDAFMWELFASLCSGATLYLAPDVLQGNVTALHRYLSDKEIEHVTLTAAVLELLPRQVWKELKTLIVMGDVVSEFAANWWAMNTRLFNAYGPTETSIAVCIHEYTGKTPANCIGKPFKNYRCYVLDQHHNLVPPGFNGELYIAGVGLAQGYMNEPHLTRASFPHVSIPQEGLYERMYKTGDIVRWGLDGNLYFKGRKDNQLKIRGVRVETGEIETALKQYPGVIDASVIYRAYGEGRTLVAFVHTQSEKIKRDAIMTYLAENLLTAALPGVFVFLPELPLNKNQKIDRNLLSEWPIASGELPGISPETETEALLNKIISQAIDAPFDDVTKSFVGLGMHSLSMCTIVAHCNTQLNCKLSIADIFIHNSVRNLARYIDKTKKTPHKTIVPGDIRRAPLTPCQKRLWYLHKLNPVDCSYNLPAVMKIMGPLDLKRFTSALNRVFREHESLRTVFRESHGEVFQEAISHTPIIMNDLLSEEKHYDISNVVKNLCEQPFGLTEMPPVRVKLIRFNEALHVLIFVKHNIITDTWSEQIVQNDLWSHYNHCEMDSVVADAPLTLQTIDLALNEPCAVESRDVVYWTEHLSDAEELIFPADFMKSSRTSNKGERVSLPLSHLLAERVLSESKRRGVTPFVILISALNFLLSKYTGQNDILIGTAVTARQSLESTRVSGFHVNTLPLRIVIDSDITIYEFLHKMSSVCVDAWRHQNLAFDRIVQCAQFERTPGKNPLFQIMAVMHDSAHSNQVHPDKCEIEHLSVHSGFSMFDMSWNFNLRENEIEVALDFATDLFSRATIDMLLSNYHQTLSELIVRPEDTPLNNLDVISRSEAAWLRSVTTNDNVSTRATLIEQIEEQVRLRPDDTALICVNHTFSYRQLWDISTRISQALCSYGESPFAVGIFMAKSCSAVAVILGVLRAGKFYVPIDTHAPSGRVNTIIENAQVRLVITDDGEKVSTKNEQITYSDLVREGEKENVARAVNAVANHIAYIMYTSGSNGVPKGVKVTYANLNNVINDFADRLHLTELDRIFSVTNISFDIFGLEVFCSLITGGRTILYTIDKAFAPETLAYLIERHAPTVIQTTPSIWNAVAGLLPDAGSTPLTLLCGGESMPPALLKVLRKKSTRLLQVYGPTETTIWSTCADLTFKGDSICIGSPVNQTQAFVMDKHGKLLPGGATGELWLGGAGVSEGYWMNDTLNKAHFTWQTVFGVRRRLYKTGDVVRFNRSGQLEFLGRNDQQVKLRGHRIELSEIDLRLCESENIEGSHSVIVGEGTQARIASYLKLKDGVIFDEHTTRASLRCVLPVVMVPSSFHIVSHFPLTPNGKVDVSHLRNTSGIMLPDQRSHTPPANKTERRMQAIWERILDVQDVSVTMDFFGLGGNSLQVPMILHAINQTFEIALTVRQFHSRPCIRDLCLYIQSTRFKESNISK